MWGQYMKSLKQFINESVVDAVIVKTKEGISINKVVDTLYKLDDGTLISTKSASELSSADSSFIFSNQGSIYTSSPEVAKFGANCLKTTIKSVDDIKKAKELSKTKGFDIFFQTNMGKLEAYVISKTKNTLYQGPSFPLSAQGWIRLTTHSYKKDGELITLLPDGPKSAKIIK